MREEQELIVITDTEKQIVEDAEAKLRLGRNRLRQGLKPSVNVAFHLIFGNAVAFLDFAF
jgi:hypothetical protein